jgi:hypothetical protein
MLRVKDVVLTAREAEILECRSASERYRHDVIELELPAAAAAAPVLAGPGATPSVALPHLATHLCRNGSRVRGALAVSAWAGWALTRGLHRALAPAVLLDAATNRLVQYRSEVPASRVAKQAREHLEIRLHR